MKRLEVQRGKTKAHLGDRFGIEIDGQFHLETIRTHINKNCVRLFDYIYNSEKLGLENLSLTHSAHGVFRAKMEKDHPELLKIIAQRKARHNLYKKHNGKK